MSKRTAEEQKLLRYRAGQRVVHALLASSFLILLITGMMLFWPPLSQYAAGGMSRSIHRVGAVLFILVPIVYLIVDRHGAKELLVESFSYDKAAIAWLKKVPRYFFGRAVDMPPQGRLNAGQKLHHAGVVIFSATVVGSGSGVGGTGVSVAAAKGAAAGGSGVGSALRRPQPERIRIITSRALNRTR